MRRNARYLISAGVIVTGFSGAVVASKNWTGQSLKAGNITLFEWQWTIPAGLPADNYILQVSSGNATSSTAYAPAKTMATFRVNLDSAYIPAGYQLVFNDEFDGSKLDTTKWWTRYVYDDGYLDILNHEQEHYREANNHIVSNGTLKLTGYKVSDNANGVNYQSGMIRSKQLVKYGYFEARVKVPGGLGVFPAFWLNPESGWPPEIDIFEFVNNGVEDTVDMLHSGNIDHNNVQGKGFLYADPAFDKTWTFYRAPYAFPDAFHTVGLLWSTDGTTTMYLDGKQIVQRQYKWVHDDGSDGGLAHILLDFAIGDPSWAGRHGIDDSKFPQALEVDYVRAYQQAGSIITGTSVIGHDLCPANGGC